MHGLRGWRKHSGYPRNPCNPRLNDVVFCVLFLILAAPQAHAKSAVAGDIIVLGSVERSGRKLVNDTSVFEGDWIRTAKDSGGVLRLGQGRVEIGESSEMEVVRQTPLRIALKSGSIAFNFPKDTAFEIVTPQLEVRPDTGEGNFSGIVTARPEKEDRVQSRNGRFTILERQNKGAANHIMPGQILVAALFLDPPQGPLGGPQIAVIDRADGDVRVARQATPSNFAPVRVPAPNLGLASGDFVRTMQGNANVVFTNDNSTITLTPGTTVQIQQQAQAGNITRRITEYLGNIWFNIQRVTGLETTLETPTAVAAIRGTQGTQEVPNDMQSTHALNEGSEQITEIVTQQSVTITAGQRVTAIRGIGFGPVTSLSAAIPQPAVGVSTGTRVATVSTVATVAGAAVAAGALAAAILAPVAASRSLPQ